MSVESYMSLQAQWNRGGLTFDEDDDLLDIMDHEWAALTDEERRQVRELLFAERRRRADEGRR